MIELPETGGVPVMRLDFSDDAAWAALQDELSAEDYMGSGYEPNLDFVERRDLAGTDPAAFELEVPREWPSASHEYSFLVVADSITMSSPERPVLLIDLNEDDTSESFRALPREVASIEANLSISNMDFFEFGDNADDDGIFRGFGG
jgi:hypothetical protein